MLKNKYAQYVLVPIVLAVWGTIFYRVYQAIKGEDLGPIVAPSFAPQALQEASVDAYELILNYRDPFLGKKGFSAGAIRESAAVQNNNNPYYSAARQVTTPAYHAAPASHHTTANSKNSNNNPPKNAKPETPEAPSIVYQGYQVFQEDTVALLKINKRFYGNVRPGDEIEGVQVQRIHKDSIRLLWDNQSLLVKRQKW